MSPAPTAVTEEATHSLGTTAWVHVGRSRPKGLPLRLPPAGGRMASPCSEAPQNLQRHLSPAAVPEGSRSSFHSIQLVAFPRQRRHQEERVGVGRYRELPEDLPGRPYCAWEMGPTVTATQWQDRAENRAAGAFDSSPSLSFVEEPVVTETEEHHSASITGTSS